MLPHRSNLPPRRCEAIAIRDCRVGRSALETGIETEDHEAKYRISEASLAHRAAEERTGAGSIVLLAV